MIGEPADFDTIQEKVERGKSDSNISDPKDQFCSNNHNSQSNYWIELKNFSKCPDMFFYVSINFQVNRDS